MGRAHVLSFAVLSCRRVDGESQRQHPLFFGSPAQLCGISWNLPAGFECSSAGFRYSRALADGAVLPVHHPPEPDLSLRDSPSALAVAGCQGGHRDQFAGVGGRDRIAVHATPAPFLEEAGRADLAFAEGLISEFVVLTRL